MEVKTGVHAEVSGATCCLGVHVRFQEKTKEKKRAFCTEDLQEGRDVQSFRSSNSLRTEGMRIGMLK